MFATAPPRLERMPTADARPRLWTAVFTSLTVGNFGVAMVFYLLTATMSAWALKDLGASQAQAGLVGTAWFLGAMVARLFAGQALLRLGERAVVLGSLVGMVVGSLLYFWCNSVPLLLLLRFAHGVAFGVAATGVAGAVLARVPVQRRGEGSGWFTFGLAIASGLGPMLGSVLQQGTDGQQRILVSSVCFAAMALGLALVVVRRLEPRPAKPIGGRHRLADYLDPTVLPIALVVSLCALPFGAVLTLMAPYAQQIGLPSAAGAYFLAYAAVIAVSRPIAGILQDRHGDTSIMVPIMVAMIAGLALTATATTYWTLVAGGALLGLGYGTLVPAGQTVALNLVGSSRAGIGVGSYFLFVDAGTGIGPFVLGALVEPLGYRGAFWVGLCFSVAGLLSMLVLRRRLSAAAR